MPATAPSTNRPAISTWGPRSTRRAQPQRTAIGRIAADPSLAAQPQPFISRPMIRDALAPLWSLPEAAELIARARRRTGLDDFGETRFAGPLDIFLRACREEADLSLFGRAALSWDTVRFLCNLLRLHAEETRRPQILDQPIRQPILITGLPRSGTTFLHNLLAEDPANRAPRIWQVIHPYPDRTSRADHRRQRVSRQLRVFGIVAPEFRRLHPVSATSPQECSEITAHVFASLRFDTTYRVPSYRRLLDAAGHLDAYGFHKRFLQHLQHQAGAGGERRWVLKCPDHVFALAAIRAVYPDARLVFVHRDPLAVLLSVARLTAVLRRPFTRRIDKFEIGRQDSDRWLAASELMIAAADAEGFAEPICHVHYPELVGDPLGTVAAIYRHFAMPFASGAADRIGRLVAAKPNGGYGARRYRFEEHGLDAARERERYQRYVTRFRIRPEAAPGRPSTPGLQPRIPARISIGPAD
ncbi:MAG: sulfotransferase family protein [Stellaceae bacterium]